MIVTARKIGNLHEAGTTSNQDVFWLVVNIVDGCEIKNDVKVLSAK